MVKSVCFFGESPVTIWTGSPFSTSILGLCPSTLIILESKGAEAVSGCESSGGVGASASKLMTGSGTISSEGERSGALVVSSEGTTSIFGAERKSSSKSQDDDNEGLTTSFFGVFAG